MSFSGETGSSYGGGAPGLSDRFVSSLLWTDKLGVAAREGISVVMRQSIYAGTYALLGESLRPNPVSQDVPTVRKNEEKKVFN